MSRVVRAESFSSPLLGGPIGISVQPTLHVWEVDISTAALPYLAEARRLLGDVPSPPIIGWISDHASLDRAVLIMPVAVLIAGAIWIYAAWRGGRHAGEAA